MMPSKGGRGHVDCSRQQGGPTGDFPWVEAIRRTDMNFSEIKALLLFAFPVKPYYDGNLKGVLVVGDRLRTMIGRDWRLKMEMPRHRPIFCSFPLSTFVLLELCKKATGHLMIALEDRCLHCEYSASSRWYLNRGRTFIIDIQVSQVRIARVVRPCGRTAD